MQTHFMDETDRLPAEEGKCKITWNEAFDGALYKANATLSSVAEGVTDVGLVFSLPEGAHCPCRRCRATPSTPPTPPVQLATMQEMIEAIPELTAGARHSEAHGKDLPARHAVLMALICADAFARNLMGASLPLVSELGAALLVVIVYLALAATVRHNRLARTDVFLAWLARRRPRAAALLSAVHDLIGALALALVWWAAFLTLQKNLAAEQHIGIQGVLTFPVWPFGLAFVVGVMTVVAVEIGLLTPPFGLSVFTIKSAMNDPDLKLGDIFRGTFPFVQTMVLCLVILAIFPGIATWLARQ